MPFDFYNIFDPAESGGLLQVILHWASYQLSTTTTCSPKSLGELINDHFQQRQKDHTPYFVLCSIFTIIIVTIFITILIFFVRKLCKTNQTNIDFTDYNGQNSSSEYQFFYHVFKELKKLKYKDNTDRIPKPSHIYDEIDSIRLTNNNSKRLTNRSIRIQIICSILILIVIFVFLVLYLSTSTSVLALAKNDQSNQSMNAILKQTFAHIETFLNRSIRESNNTLINIFQESYVPVEKLFRNFGSDILNAISDDFYLTKLLKIFDEFLGLIKTTMRYMERIAASRESAITPLITFATKIAESKKDIEDIVAKSCREKPLVVGVQLCNEIHRQLDNLKVMINHTQLDTDSSITMTTLLNKVLKLNITHVEIQVEIARKKLTSSLDAISQTTMTLLDSLIASVSNVFASAGNSIKQIIEMFEQVTQNESVWSAVSTADVLMTLLVVITAIMFLLAMIISGVMTASLVRYQWIHNNIQKELRQFHDDGTNTKVVFMLTDIKTSNSEVNNNLRTPQPSEVSSESSQSVVSGSMDLELDYGDGQVMQTVKPPVVNGIRHTVNRKRNKLLMKENNSFRYMCLRDCTITILIIGIFVAVPILYSFGAFYLSGEVYIEGCKYLISNRGIAIWDNVIDKFSNSTLWPIVKTSIDSVAIPLHFYKMPTQIVSSIYNQCSNSSATMFEIFDLVNIINATEVLNSDLSLQQFDKGLDMIIEQINNTDADTIVPKELKAMQDLLPQIAIVFDNESYGDSIAELNKPLLGLTLTGLDSMMKNVDTMATRLRSTDTSDQAAVILPYLITKLNDTVNANYQKNILSLQTLKVHYETLEKSRYMGNLTSELVISLNQVLTTFLNKPAMLLRVETRFNESMLVHFPHFAKFLEPFPSKLLRSIGYCDDLEKAGRVIENQFCSDAMLNISTGAVYLFILSLLLQTLIILSFLILLKLRAKKLSTLQSHYNTCSTA